jgi:hypothetical protein
MVKFYKLFKYFFYYISFQLFIASIISMIEIKDYYYDILLLSIYIILNFSIVLYLYYKIFSLKKKLKEYDNSIQLTNINDKSMTVIYQT